MPTSEYNFEQDRCCHTCKGKTWPGFHLFTGSSGYLYFCSPTCCLVFLESNNIPSEWWITRKQLERESFTYFDDCVQCAPGYERCRGCGPKRFLAVQGDYDSIFTDSAPDLFCSVACLKKTLEEAE